MTLEQVIDGILEREGSTYTNDPADGGGPTKYGVTVPALSIYWKRQASSHDVMTLTEAEARGYYQWFLTTDPILCRLGSSALYALFSDCEVNHGRGGATKLLQRALGVKDDGVAGPQTIAALNAADPAKLYRGLCAERVEFYGRIIAHDDAVALAKANGIRLQAEFAAGWLSRAAGFIREAVS